MHAAHMNPSTYKPSTKYTDKELLNKMKTTNNISVGCCFLLALIIIWACSKIVMLHTEMYERIEHTRTEARQEGRYSQMRDFIKLGYTRYNPKTGILEPTPQRYLYEELTFTYANETKLEF